MLSYKPTLYIRYTNTLAAHIIYHNVQTLGVECILKFNTVTYIPPTRNYKCSNVGCSMEQARK